MSDLKLRKILRRTVKVNANRGRSEIYTSLPPDSIVFQVTAHSGFGADDIAPMFRPVIQSSTVRERVGDFELHLIGDAALAYGLQALHAMVLACPRVMRAEMMPVKTRIQRHSVLPDYRTYLFEYEDIEVECENCGRTCKVSELESDSEFELHYSAKVCPHCSVWECAEWDDESLSGEELKDLAEANLGIAGTDGSGDITNMGKTITTEDAAEEAAAYTPYVGNESEPDPVKWARESVILHQDNTNSDDEEAVADLLADLMHFCTHNGLDFEDELRRGHASYESES